MASTNEIRLTASEISNLWTSYQNDTMAICGITYFLANIDDQEIRSILEYALKISTQHVEKVTEFLIKEQYPIPIGFTEQDVNLEAPRLFSDKIYLEYILNMGKLGLNSYSLALTFVSRDDMIDFYSDCLAETTKLHNDAKRLAKSKGIYIRDAIIPAPNQVDFVKKKSFLTGFIGNRRPLLGVEIANLFYNAKRNALGQAIIMGFEQVAKKTEVRKYFERGQDISTKHFKIFNKILLDDFINGPLNLTQEVTVSTVSPFSDKLMMYHIAALSATAVGQYGASISMSPRHDLGIAYARLIAEIMNYTNDGANIMIEHGWMEQPPEACNRQQLAQKKEK